MIDSRDNLNFRQNRECVLNHQRPHGFLHKGGTNTAHEIVDKEFTAAPLVFQNGRKHQHGKHIAEYMSEIGVHKHIRKWLPNIESRCGEIVKAEYISQLNAITLQYDIKHPNDKIREEQVACNCR